MWIQPGHTQRTNIQSINTGFLRNPPLTTDQLTIFSLKHRRVQTGVIAAQRGWWAMRVGELKRKKNRSNILLLCNVNYKTLHRVNMWVASLNASKAFNCNQKAVLQTSPYLTISYISQLKSQRRDGMERSDRTFELKHNGFSPTQFPLWPLHPLCINHQHTSRAQRVQFSLKTPWWTQLLNAFHLVLRWFIDIHTLRFVKKMLTKKTLRCKKKKKEKKSEIYGKKKIVAVVAKTLP